jgi:hypothetical protein
MRRPTPERHDEDDAFIAELVSEAGDPKVEPRLEHVAELRVLILDRLGPARPRRRPRAWWLAVPGLAAACLAAVVIWPRGNTEDRPVSGSGRPSANPIASRPLPDQGGIAGWRNIRQTLDVSEMPPFSWPLEGSSRLAVSTRIPADLLD